MRDEGYMAYVTEHWNAYAFIRQDLYGFIDILCMKEGEQGLLAIQTTSRGNISTRINKILALPASRVWLLTGNRIEVQGWDKKDKHWRVKRVPLDIVQ
jgi:hypothetical protein